MIIDSANKLSAAQAITSNAASTSCVKLGANAGKGRKIKFLFRVDTAFHDSSSTDATLTITLQSATTAAGSYSDIAGASTGAIALAGLTAGAMYELVLPPVHSAFVQAYYTVANGPFDAGKIDCMVVEDVQSNLTH